MATEEFQENYHQEGQQFGENISNGFNGLVDTWQGNILAQAYSDQAIAESQAGVATKLMANRLKPLDGLLNIVTGGGWSANKHSFYLDADEFGDNLINSAGQHAEMANAGFTGQGVSGVVEAQEATKDIDYAAAYDQHMSAAVDSVKQSVVDGVSEVGKSMQNIPAMMGAGFGEFQKIMQQMQENNALGTQFADDGVKQGVEGGIKEVGDTVREVVDKSTVDLTATTPTKDIQAGA